METARPISPPVPLALPSLLHMVYPSQRASRDFLRTGQPRVQALYRRFYSGLVVRGRRTIEATTVAVENLGASM